MLRIGLLLVGVFLLVFGFLAGAVFVYLGEVYGYWGVYSVPVLIHTISRYLLAGLLAGIVLLVVYGLVDLYFLRDYREKLKAWERSLIRYEEKLRNKEEELERRERLYEKEIEAKYKAKHMEILRALEEDRKKKLALALREMMKEVSEKQEEVYKDFIKKSEKVLNELRARIHNQREHIKALNRKIENLRKFTEQRVIDIVAKAERNWVLKGLRRRNDLQIIKEKLRKG